MYRFLHIIIYAALLTLAATPMHGAGDDGSKFIVVLDAGHGGKDPGTIGSVASYREKDIVLNITKEVGRLLKSNHPNMKVIYTRSTDVFVELGRRAEIANKAKANLFVSIHVNSLPKNSGNTTMGVQSYTLSLKTLGTNLEVEKRENSVIALEGEAAKQYNYNQSPESNIMFELMQDHDMKESVAFAKMAQNEMVRTAGRKDMGVRQANLAVLRLTYMPSVLLEVGFISSPSEEKYLVTDAGQKALAKSIYNAIANYSNKRNGTATHQTQTPSTATHQTEPPAQEDTATTDDTPSTAEAPAKKETVYKVQVLAGTVKLKSNDRQLKGLKCEMHQTGNRYTYTYGSTTSLQEAKKLRKSILDKFPEAFIVTY